MQDKREILFGLDYKRRVREVEERDNHMCRRPVIAGGTPMQTFCAAVSNGRPHHLIKRSKLRDDRASNLSSRCNNCHRREHPEFEPQFSAKDAERNHRLNKELVNDESAELDTEATEARK
jgi:hypothetical protein